MGIVLMLRSCTQSMTPRFHLSSISKCVWLDVNAVRLKEPSCAFGVHRSSPTNRWVVTVQRRKGPSGRGFGDDDIILSL